VPIEALCDGPRVLTFKKITGRIAHALLDFEDDVRFCVACAIEHERRRIVEQTMVQTLKPQLRGFLVISTR
jgi:hypothetical protein